MAVQHLNTEKVWEKSGKNEFVRVCRSTNDKHVLRQAFYELLVKVIDSQLKTDSIISPIIDVINHNEDTINILSDVLLLCDVETQTSENKDQREQFNALLTALNNKTVSEWILKERLDYETTGDAKIISNKKAASTKFIKLKTRLFYKQQKFNLCREESEGYGKLIIELCQDGGFNYNYMLQVIKSLIGCFNLDPNRVLDIILECFEHRIHLQDCYLPLLKHFLENSNTLTQILAFKFSFYQQNDSQETPESLYEVAALVLYNKLIELNQISPYLYPNDNKIYDQYKADLTEAKTFAKRSNAIATGDAKAEEHQISDEEKRTQFIENQKLGLILALLKVGDWNNAKELIYKLPEYYAVSFEKIAKQLCILIHFVSDKIYRQYSGLPSLIAAKLKPYHCEKDPLLKQVDNINDLRSIAFPMICSLGPYLYKDTLLVAKVIRICRTLLNSSNADVIKYAVYTILDEAVFPAFSLVESNCALSEEFWLLLKTFPYQYRYKLYTNWKSDPTNSVMIKTRAVTMKRIKYIMKRLSKENVKLSGRQIGKLSHSNPSFLFEYILSQIQSYDNLIGPVVDSLKYLTCVSYDVLSFCVIEALANPSREKTKHDGATISPWLLSLANFCGSVVKKYPIELPGLLQFVANQLKSEKSLDLLILKEIVQKMAGIEATEEMTNEQLNALSGGELLRAEGGYFNQVRNTKKSTVRLKDALLENNLAMPLCILMAQQRNCILFHEQEHTHLKLIGKLYDQCQETLVQYGSFLSNSLSIEDYIGRLPPLDKLVADYNLSADITFFLVRPMIIHDITSKYDELRKNDKSSKSLQNYIESSEIVTTPLVKAIIPAYPQKFWDDLSPRFFVTFWTLTMYDLQVPTASYERELQRFKQQAQQADENKDLAPNKKKKERERCLNMMERLADEESKQQEHVKRVLSRLEKEKDQWFQSKVAKMEMTTQFLQHCLFPRCKFTASDALFCAKFVHLLHNLQTPNFSTLICYDRIFGDISYTMCSCTENEANHYGRFLCALLETVMNWHKDKAIFDKECAKYPGFVTKFCEKDPLHVDFENYRHVCHKWHYRLTKAFILCLDSGDYIQIRNSLIILTKILPHFPIMISFAQAIERRVENIRNEEKEKRPDLYALATGYSGQLKIKKPSFIPESEFHIKESKKSAQQPNVQNNNSHKIEVNIKKEQINSLNNATKTIVLSKEKKESIKLKNNTEVNDNIEKKKDMKNELIKNDFKNRKVIVDDKANTAPEKTSRDSSVASLSPRRVGEHRIKEDVIDSDKEKIATTDREHKKRKFDNNKPHEETNDKRNREDNITSQNAQIARTYEKKSSALRKRQQESPNMETPDTIKRRKDDDKLSTKRSEDRESTRNKNVDNKRSASSSRRHKQNEDK